GCPLRQLYLPRFPSQYGWVADLAAPATRRAFVKRVTNEWVNVAAPSDPIGRTVFAPPPKVWQPGLAAPPPAGLPALPEHLLAEGGHTSYWTAPDLFAVVARLIG